MELEEYDLTRICRTCKAISPQCTSIFEVVSSENNDEVTQIHEMLMACASVQIDPHDGMPNLICDLCLESLKMSYLFKKQCENVDTSLREYLTKKLHPMGIKEEQSQAIEVNNYLENFIKSSFVKPSNDVAEPVQNHYRQKSNSASILNKDLIELLDNNQMVLTCCECAKVFTTLDGLRSHKRIHSGALFKCKYCDKEYTRQNHLQRHELQHGKRKVHVCRICSKTLTRFEHLKRHLTTHLKEKPFVCGKCKRGFNRAEHLDNHSARCKGDRVHICDICNKGFNRADSLEVHKKLHENQAPVLPTLDNLDNIEDHYYEIDYDGNGVSSFTEMDDEDVDDYLEPQVEVTEGTAHDIVEDGGDHMGSGETTTLSAENGEITVTKFKAEVDLMQFKKEPSEEGDDDDMMDYDGMDHSPGHDDDDEEDEDNDEDDVALSKIKALVSSGTSAKAKAIIELKEEGAGEDSDSAHSEYLPSKKKRGRGRPRKHPIKLVGPHRARGRPRGRFMKQKQHPEVEEEIGVFPCPECEQVFTKMSLLERHADSHHPGLRPHKCKVCMKDFRRGNQLKRHMLSHSLAKPHTCDVCQKSFHRKDHLTQHIKLHDKQMVVECEICMKTFHRLDHLVKHKASKHNIGERIVTEKKFECHVCNKTFTTEKYRDVHVKGHMGLKKFQCRTCDKSFLSKSHLTEHVKFHNDQSKKFLCSECGQRFIRNDYLVIHMRRHRGEKPFKCKFCGKGFPRTTDLTVHERYHTGEKTHLCTICGRGFGRAYNLTVHMRTHTGEKPYQCTYCDAAFAQGNDLKAHVRRHTGERFQCELCSESFLMGYLLTQHKRSVHGLNVVSNIRRLQPVNKIDPDNPNEPPPITIPLPKPVIPDPILNLQAQLSLSSVVQLQHHLAQQMIPE